MFIAEYKMKKGFTILIAAIMLTTGLKVSLDHHYCGGKLAATKLSVMGKLALCGMEEKENTCSNQPSIDKKCCEDQLTYFEINTNYVPKYFKISLPTPGKDIPIFLVNNIKDYYSDKNNFTSWVFPPGNKIKSGHSLSEICVFRI